MYPRMLSMASHLPLVAIPSEGRNGTIDRMAGSLDRAESRIQQKSAMEASVFPSLLQKCNENGAVATSRGVMAPGRGPNRYRLQG